MPTMFRRSSKDASSISMSMPSSPFPSIASPRAHAAAATIKKPPTAPQVPRRKPTGKAFPEDGPVQAFALDADREFWAIYSKIRTIGKGNFASVKEVEHRKTGERFAVKVLDKMAEDNSIEDMVSEFNILKTLRHRNVIRLYAAYETKDVFYLVTELATGGELMKRLTDATTRVYSEAEVRRHVKTLVETVTYMHSKNIAHRDLKPENVLLSDESPDADIKIIDLGLSRVFKDKQLMNTVCGTHRFLAPELVETDRGMVRGYSPAVDMWGIGMLTYIMLFGTNPFEFRTQREIHDAILRCDVPYPDFNNVSEEAKRFIGQLLRRNPATRMTSEEAINHKWLAADPSELDCNIDEELSVGHSLRKGKGKGMGGGIWDEPVEDEGEGEGEEVIVKKSVRERLFHWNTERLLSKAVKGQTRRLSASSLAKVSPAGTSPAMSDRTGRGGSGSGSSDDGSEDGPKKAAAAGWGGDARAKGRRFSV